MSKTFLLKTGVALLCLAVVLAFAPGLNSAEKAPKIGLSLMLRQPGLLLSSVIPSFGASFLSPSISVTISKLPPAKGRVRPTNDLGIPKPSTGD